MKLNTVPLDLLEKIAAAAAPHADVKSWRQLMPALSDMVNFFDAGMWLFGMIFFLAAALGVMNTMLMSTFERIREFGILKAIGTSPWRILGDVAVEAFVLSLISTALRRRLMRNQGLPAAGMLAYLGVIPYQRNPSQKA